MLRRTLSFVVPALLVLPIVTLVPLNYVWGRSEKIRDAAPVSSVDREAKVTRISGTIKSVDLKKRTMVVTEHHDGGQPDKMVKLSWGRKLKPKQGGKETDWQSIRPGMLATAKYHPGKENTLVELTVAR